MKQRSFFFRLFMGNLLLVSLILLVICLVAYNYLNSEYMQKDQLQQDRLSRTLQRQFELSWPGSASQVDSMCKSLMEGMPARLTVIAKDGLVLGDSQADPKQMENHLTKDRPEILLALKGQTRSEVRTSETLGKSFIYLARPVRRDGQITAVVRLATPVRTLMEEKRFIHHALLWSVLSAIVVAVTLGWLISWIWAKPLKEITRTARKIADGNLKAKAVITGSRELKNLGTALNQMRENLASQIQQVEAQHDNLRTVIANLREGLIALDDSQNVVLMNESAQKLLCPGMEHVSGEHIQSVIRVPEVLDILNALKPDKPISRQIEVELDSKQRTLDIHIACIELNRSQSISTLIVVNDITEIAQTAAMKAEFVANASHELRTPVATIRAAVDSLMELPPDEPDSLAKLISILDRHTRRLEQMTKDLLDLHVVEQAKRTLRLEDVQLEHLTKWVQTHFTLPASEEQLSFKVSSNAPDFRFRTDETLVQLILRNLIENSIKFTPRNGSILCTLDRHGDGVILKVTDSGCGIPAVMHDRVFERFFQADASRSGDKTARGTGLGLAIVKYAAERLGARITLQSEVGHGTSISVLIPTSEVL